VIDGSSEDPRLRWRLRESRCYAGGFSMLATKGREFMLMGRVGAGSYVGPPI
jgi:hypothetical protein